jgi:head-tail adaptor
MNGAGKLFDKIAFDAPVSTSNGYGGVTKGWEEAAQVRANIKFLRGGEAVQAARLQGKQPVVFTVRTSVTLGLADPSWRIRDLRTSIVYNIRSIIRSEDRQWLEITAESGVPE